MLTKPLLTKQHYHTAQFYRDSHYLAQSVGDFVLTGLSAGEGVVIIATREHNDLIRDHVTKAGIDLNAVAGQLILLDAQQTLNRFMQDGLPSEPRFLNSVGKLIDDLSKTFPLIRAYGEMVNILWGEGNLPGTIALEKLWNELAKTREFSLLCGYDISKFNGVLDEQALSEVCGCHSHVIPIETFTNVSSPQSQFRYIAELQRKASVLEREISERKALEEKLLKTQAELMRAKEEAESASRAKSQFLANMSHEIRTPMNAILGFSKLVQEAEVSQADRAKYLSRVQANGEHLLRLIDDVLDLSRVEAGEIKIDKAPMSVHELLSDIHHTLKLLVSDKEIAVKLVVGTSTPEMIMADQGRIRQILMNLISNAAKFTKKGFIALRVAKSSRDGFLEFEVEDTGIGIGEQVQGSLFRPFSQGDTSVTRRFGGTGLGLVLSRRIAESLGGELNLVRSELGKGSLLRATLPAEECSTGESYARAATVPTDIVFVKRLKILVAEDSQDNHELIEAYLKRANVDMDRAYDGQEAVQKVMAESYDIVLMDMQMPTMDGIKSTQLMRSNGFAGPIIALTAHAFPEEVSRSLSAGCTSHLSKPVSKATLLSELSKHL